MCPFQEHYFVKKQEKLLKQMPCEESTSELKSRSPLDTDSAGRRRMFFPSEMVLQNAMVQRGD